MKRPLPLSCLGIAILGLAVDGQAQELITFDDLPGNGAISNGYAGLDWDNFYNMDVTSAPPGSGYYCSAVSPPIVAFNAYGAPASIISPNGQIDLDSAYLTAALDDYPSLTVAVQGFLGSTMLYNSYYTIHDNGPILIDFNYDGIDSATFTTFPSVQFAMDNVTITVPEPGTWAAMLMGAGVGGYMVNRRSLKAYQLR